MINQDRKEIAKGIPVLQCHRIKVKLQSKSNTN